MGSLSGWGCCLAFVWGRNGGEDGGLVIVDGPASRIFERWRGHGSNLSESDAVGALEVSVFPVENC